MVFPYMDMHELELNTASVPLGQPVVVVVAAVE